MTIWHLTTPSVSWDCSMCSRVHRNPPEFTELGLQYTVALVLSYTDSALYWTMFILEVMSGKKCVVISDWQRNRCPFKELH